MSKKLDIFEVLKKIDECDILYFHNLSEDELKSIHPLVIMRWLSGTKDSAQIQRLNAISNIFTFSLQKEKLLLIKLLMVSSTSKKTYKWHSKKAPTVLPKSNIEIVMDYYNCSKKEAVEAVKILSKSDILELAEELGYQKDDMTGVK
jgi:NACalpha-BTF3-like transcription factor